VKARKRGAKFGRKPKLAEHQQTEAKQRLAKGETCRAIARTVGCITRPLAVWIAPVSAFDAVDGFSTGARSPMT
jgi:hypothetical protein